MPSDILGLNTGSGIPDTSGASYETTASQDRANALQQHRTNVQMSLLAAGLAMMAARPGRGRGQFARAVGEGGLTGLQSYETGEENIARGQQATVAQRATEAYRKGELGIRQATLGLTEQMRQTQEAAEKERERHDTAMLAIQQQNAGTGAYRASLEAQRNQIEQEKVGIEGAKASAELAPVGKDVLKSYRGTNVEKLLGLPDADAVAAMPRKDADALLRDVRNSYSKALTAKEPPPRYIPMGDLKIHKVWTDKDGKDHDDVIGPAVIKGGAGGMSEAAKAVIGESAPGLLPPGSAAPSNMPPSAPPAATPATGAGAALGPVDRTKFKDGRYKMPDGRIIEVRDGVAYPVS